MFETISNTVSVRYKISHPDWFGVLRIIQVMIIHRFKFQQTLGRTNTMHPHVVAAAKAYYHHMHLHKHWQGHMFTNPLTFEGPSASREGVASYFKMQQHTGLHNPFWISLCSFSGSFIHFYTYTCIHVHMTMYCKHRKRVRTPKLLVQFHLPLWGRHPGKA